jgi:hypothetical protein
MKLSHEYKAIICTVNKLLLRKYVTYKLAVALPQRCQGVQLVWYPTVQPTYVTERNLLASFIRKTSTSLIFLLEQRR